MPSAYAIEMALDGDRVRKREKDVCRPRKWDAYQNGTRVPNDIPGPRNAINQAEARFPGTARWFRSPLWRFLKGESFNSMQFEDALRTLEPPVMAVLFEAASREFEQEPRPRPFDDESAGQLIALASFDALVAAVLMTGLSEVIASPDLRERALGVYLGIQAKLRQEPLMESIYPELFSLIDSRCKHWIYLAPNRRLDVVIFWQGVEAEEEGRVVDEDLLGGMGPSAQATDSPAPLCAPPRVKR